LKAPGRLPPDNWNAKSKAVMNDGMPGMNNHCYTEATGHPANRNCSSGWTEQQRAPVNAPHQRMVRNVRVQNGAAPFASLISQIGTTPTIFTFYIFYY